MYERLYRSLYRIRRVEEEVARAYPTDRIKSPVHLSIGQEAVSVGVCEALRSDDVVFGSYRGHALYLAKGGGLKEMIAELFGKVGGCARGKGGSMHLIAPGAGVMGMSAVVGTTIPNAVGYAYALKCRGGDSVVASFFGDGATEEGVFAESLNFAVLKRLPVLFVCENNQYAIHTHQSRRNGYVTAPIAGLPTEHAEPGVETRVELWRRWGDTRRIEIATGFHDNSSTVGTNSITSRVYSIDWMLRPLDHLELSGFFYNGQNVADLGALPQGFAFDYYRAHAVHSTGGWAQLRIPVTQRLAFDFYGGRQDDRNSDLSAGYIGLNAGYFANVMYRIAPNVFVSLEGGQIRTTYLVTGNRLNNHYDLAVAYSF